MSADVRLTVVEGAGDRRDVLITALSRRGERWLSRWMPVPEGRSVQLQRASLGAIRRVAEDDNLVVEVGDGEN